MVEHSTDKQMSSAVEKLINHLNAVYSDELMKETGLTRERVTIYLKSHGFIKELGRKTRRYVNHNYKHVGNHDS